MFLKQMIGCMTILSCFVITVASTYAVGTTAESSSQAAEKEVRAGLIYSKKSADKVEIGSDEGLRIGEAVKGGVTSLLFDIEGSKPVSVMKNVYYEKKDGLIKIISYNGRVSENWHLKITTNLGQYSEGLSLMNTYKKRGLETFLYYDGKWQILTGIYEVTEAASYYQKDLEKLYPDLIFTQFKPGESSVLLLNQENNPWVVFNRSEYELSILPQSIGMLKLNDDPKKVYRGRFSVYRFNGVNLEVINVLSIESYLYGVVPEEIGGNSPLEAAKSQAIAARNYTYNNLDKHHSEGFDLCNTTECQVYGGKSSESENSNRAVDETKNKLLKYNGKNAEVFYFSSTGGVDTEDVENVWGSSIPYLKSVESQYETGKTYHAQWDYAYTKDEIKNFLKNKNVDVGEIVDIVVTKRSKAGRVVELKVLGTKGEKLFLREGSRTIFRLDSQYYDIITATDVFVKGVAKDVKTSLAGKSVITAKGVEIIGAEKKSIHIIGNSKTIQKDIQVDKFTFSGKGWGHSVGLSQDGAIGMAKAGLGYENILTHYFPGTYVE